MTAPVTHHTDHRASHEPGGGLAPAYPAELQLSRQSRAVGALAMGAIALGALAFGALAIGAVAIGRMAVARARIRRLKIDELIVRNLRISGRLQAPPAG
jgi:hypothetical protein